MVDNLNLPIEEVEEVEMENEHGGSFSLCISNDDDGSNLHGVPLEENVLASLDDVSIVVPTVEENARILHPRGSRGGRRLLYGMILVKLRGVV
ncbi:hypothetical protein SLA2020_263280 [Shorea laevis]